MHNSCTRGTNLEAYFLSLKTLSHAFCFRRSSAVSLSFGASSGHLASFSYLEALGHKMEEPDAEEITPTPIVFKSAGKDITGAEISRKEAKKSAGERLKMRKSTPRPSFKGDGKKRFCLTPSPKFKPSVKRAYVNKENGGDGPELKNKRNLMVELNEAGVCDSSNTVVEALSKIQMIKSWLRRLRRLIPASRWPEQRKLRILSILTRRLRSVIFRRWNWLL